MIDCSSKLSLEELYVKTAKLLAHKLRTMVAPELADEILQEIYLSAWKTKKNFENVAAAYSYLYRSAHHRVIDEFRKGKVRNQDRSTEVSKLAIWRPAENVNVCDLQRALEQLTESQARIVWYYWVDEMTQDEIAELESVSRKTVQREILRAQSRMQVFFGKENHGAIKKVALSHSS